MLKIKKDNVINIVTAGAYEDFYKDLGFEIVKEGKKVATEEVAPVPEAKELENTDELVEDKKEEHPVNKKRDRK